MSPVRGSTTTPAVAPGTAPAEGLGDGAAAAALGSSNVAAAMAAPGATILRRNSLQGFHTPGHTASSRSKGTRPFDDNPHVFFLLEIALPCPRRPQDGCEHLTALNASQCVTSLGH